MAKKYTDEEREKRILLVYECIVSGMSIRACAKYLLEQRISISIATISDYIERMKDINITKYNELREVIDSHTPKNIKNDKKIELRVKSCINLLLQGHTFEEIAELLEESYWTIYYDFTKRVKRLTEEERNLLGITSNDLVKIQEIINNRVLSNLRYGKVK